MNAAVARPWGMALGVAALCLSLALFLRTLWQAAALERPSAPPAAVVADTTPIRGEPATHMALSDVLTAVAEDPFHPERRVPDRRFSVDEGPVVGMAPAPAGSLRLTGTALLPSGAFALVALGAESPRIVRVGERVGPYRLVAIRKGEAEFDMGGENVTLTVLEAGR